MRLVGRHQLPEVCANRKRVTPGLKTLWFTKSTSFFASRENYFPKQEERRHVLTGQRILLDNHTIVYDGLKKAPCKQPAVSGHGAAERHNFPPASIIYWLLH